MTLWDDDETLMQYLDEALQGAVSDSAREAAQVAFAWRTIDEDLMRLDHDSLLTDEVLTRSAAVVPRVLGFQGTNFTLEVELDAGTLMGQVVPGRVCRISVLSPVGETRSVDTDESGFFSLRAPEGRLVRFTVEHEAATQSTEWLRL
ncbi:MAG: hypothetical protein ABI873_13045 [Marmoricola sp.]